MTMGFKVQLKWEDRNNLAGFLRKYPKEVTSDVEDTFWNIAHRYRNEIIRKMRDTPRRADSSSKRTAAGLRHRPSRPGHPPAIDSGNLIGSMRVGRIRGGAQYVIKGAKYAPILEAGASSINLAARPVYGVTLRAMQSDITRSAFRTAQKAARRNMR